MRSLLDDLDQPATRAFIDVTEQVMSSSTYHFKVGTDVPLPAQNGPRVEARELHKP